MGQRLTGMVRSKRERSGAEPQSSEPSGRGEPASRLHSTEITKEDVNLPKIFKGRLAFVLHNVFTAEECTKYIEDSENRGYELALVNTGVGSQVKATDVRNSSRNIWDSKKEAKKILKRIRDYLPETWNGGKLVELNERLRFLRYDPGEYFKPHMDGSYKRDNGDESQITVFIYLNEGFVGGSTTFLSLFDSDDSREEVVPKTGSVLIFQHNIVHEGSELIKGRKYAIRTEVMYKDRNS
ncbi:uncharacterized protein LOC125683003 [Ostrea edulis]|uniref:uncharacterized protein LOC125683003 n=1 Tax=Ostrea edulis TaxID=37623 RepID=UPI0024AEF2DF|nr:uncharacterized protein LOC125683003 [Ostrea edulis]